MKNSDLLEMFKALANENRQLILFSVFCDKEPHSVNEVAERVGLAQSTASEHLSILRRAGLLESKKINKQVLYNVDKKSVEKSLAIMKDWLTCC